jgi:tol-pal system protein YbgF
MCGLKNHLCSSILFLVICFSFVACGGVSSRTPSAGDTGQKIPPQPEGEKLESEMVGLRRELESLKLAAQDQETLIRQLAATVVALEEKTSLLENQNRSNPISHPTGASTPGDLYKRARHFLTRGNYLTAAALFTEFIKDHPRDSLAGNAVYWLGECHYSLGNHQQAISVFKDLISTYPKSEKVPDALLKTGYAYLGLNDANRANHYLKQVLKKYPFSQAAEKAQEKLRSFE